MPTAMVEFSNRILKVQPSLTLGITAKAKQMKAQGIQVISFGAGEPDFDTPEPIKQAAIASLNKGFTKYTPENGTLELRKAICDKFKRDNELDYTPDQIVVSCGAKHSLYNLFQVLLNEGDEVIIPSPFWLSYPEMATLAGAKSVIVPTKRQDHYLMSAGDLEKAITPRTKILVLNSPSNPAGVVYSKERMLEILSVARKHSFFIISDEIYEKLIFDGMKHYSPAQLCPDLKSRIIVVNGFSKVYAMTGWRLGYLAADKEIAKVVSTLQSHSTSNPTSFAQVAAQAALEGPQDEVARRCKIFEERRNKICKEIDRISQLSYVRPQGAFYIFCGTDKVGMGSIELCEKLLDEARVAAVPGIVFGDDRAIRLSFAMSDQEMVEGLKRISEWLSKK